MFPFEFRGEVRHGKTGVMGLPCGVSFMILASTVFVQSTRVTDVRTDRIAITYTRYSIMLSRATELACHEHAGTSFRLYTDPRSQNA